MRNSHAVVGSCFRASSISAVRTQYIPSRESVVGQLMLNNLTDLAYVSPGSNLL